MPTVPRNHRARIVPGPRTAAANQASQSDELSATDRQRGLTWAQRLKRVFAIDMPQGTLS